MFIKKELFITDLQLDKPLIHKVNNRSDEPKTNAKIDQKY